MGLFDRLEGISGKFFGGNAVGPTGGMMQRTLKDKIPELATIGLDQGTKDVLARQMASANQSEGDIANEALSGAKEQGQGLINVPADPVKSGEEQPAGFSEALSKRATKNYDKDFNKLQRQANIDAKAEKYRRTEQLANLYGKQQNTIIADADRKNQAILNSARARNAVIGQVTGQFGSMMGAFTGMFGGGGGGNKQQSTKSTSDYKSSEYGGGQRQNNAGESYGNSGGYA